MEWADLCNDDEALGEDRDFAAAFAAEELAPPAAPAGPPPGVVLPPPPPPVALAPLAPGAIKVEGNLVYLAGAPRPIGRQSALVHWYPPAFATRCLQPGHGRCSLTADCTEDAMDALQTWVAHAADFPDADAHRAAAPDVVRDRRGR